MEMCIYFRSTEVVHPALTFELRRQTQELSARNDWTLCEPPELEHQSDGHVSGVIEFLIFDEEDEVDVLANLLDVVQILATLSSEHPIDWEFSHDYEEGVLGRIIQGKIEPVLVDELETISSIINLFGEFPEEEEDLWLEPDEPLSVEPAEPAKPRLLRETETPYVLKFPGVQ